VVHPHRSIRHTGQLKTQPEFGGILQAPFFNPSADDAINYGAIGAVIGNEITHGYDDQGAEFDLLGNLKNWWTEADKKNFDERAVCVVKQLAPSRLSLACTFRGSLFPVNPLPTLAGFMSLRCVSEVAAG
jgi:hypothetical protein